MARPKSIHNRTQMIIEAADELFSRYSFERTSIDDIARHLGISKGSIYLDFKTKEDIYIAVVEKHADKFHQMIDAMVENSHESGIGTLKMVLKRTSALAYEFVTSNFHTPEAMLYASMTIKSRCGHFFTRKRNLYQRLLERAAADGEIAPEKATEETAVMLMMATSSLYPPYLNNFSESNKTVTAEELAARAERLVDFICLGLTASAPNGPGNITDFGSHTSQN